MSPEAKAALSEEYSNSFNFAEGEIYGKIRDYQRRNKPFAERRWRSYLSKCKQKGLSQLLRRERYKEAFDTLLGIRGLWSGPGFSLGNMQEVLAMRFDEVCWKSPAVSVRADHRPGDPTLSRPHLEGMVFYSSWRLGSHAQD